MRTTGTYERRYVRAAEALLDQTGGGAADPFVLARCCRLRLHPRARVGAALRGQDLFYDYRSAPYEQRWMVAECLARLALERAGEAITRAAVQIVAELLSDHAPQGGSTAASGF